MTKEADWDVARAYAVLAQSSASSSSTSNPSFARYPPLKSSGIRVRGDFGNEEGEKKNFDGDEEKESVIVNARQGVMTTQDMAVDAYLEDNEWEARERAAGHAPRTCSVASRST